MTRLPATAERVREFMRETGRLAPVEGRIIFAGGASAVLLGWRETTRDIDLAIEPDAADAVLGPIVGGLREALSLNIEFASPTQFIGWLPGGVERRASIELIGRITFLHEDLYTQALAKVARGIEHDVADVQAMLQAGLIRPERAWELFEQIVSRLYRFPVDPGRFREQMVNAFGLPPQAPTGLA